jgi:U4/U6 small nuclear ribonucleoprotein PRP3
LTLSNFIQVLGDQAFVDPSQIEQKVLEQVQARQRTHLQRNADMKLTKEQRAAKRARKLAEHATAVSVALFFVKDASHPYHRTLLDLNAQQNGITGGVLECPSVETCLILAEGGPKAIERYKRLLLVRMKWTGPGEDDDVNDDNDNSDSMLPDSEHTTRGVAHKKFNPDNKCELVWQGLALKPLFKGFVFQSCETPEQTRQVLHQKGIAHYWDQVARHVAMSSRDVPLKLTTRQEEDASNDSDSNPYRPKDGDEDFNDDAVIVMEE